MVRILMTVIFLLFAIIPSCATEYINNNPGGRIEQFLDHYARLKDSGDNVVISGYCYSACTLVTAFIDRSKACVTPDAVFGFHSGWVSTSDGRETYSRDATSEMWRSFPPRIKRLVRSKGWNGISAHPNLVKIPGTAIYPLCRSYGWF